MRCRSCDADIPEGAAACPRCGAALGSPSPWTQWETCIIEREVGAETRYAGPVQRTCRYAAFIAYARGPGSVYLAGRSRRVALGADEGASEASAREGAPDERRALEDLRAWLRAQGWEPLDRGEEWYHHRFRREWTPRGQRRGLKAVGTAVGRERAEESSIRRQGAPAPARARSAPGCYVGLLWLVSLAGCVGVLRGRGSGRGSEPSRS